MTSKRLITSCSLVAAVTFLAAPHVHATSGAWKLGIDGSTGNWGDSGKWQDGVIADGAGSTATFAFDRASTVTVNDANRTLGILNIGSTSGVYNLTASGGRKLIMDNNGAMAQINLVGSAAQSTVSTGIDITDGGLTISGSAANQVTFSGALTSVADEDVILTLSKEGTNNLVVSGAISEGGGSVKVVVDTTSNVALRGDNSYTGGLHVKKGNAILGLSGAGDGGIVLGETGVSNSMALHLEAKGTYSNDIHVKGGSASIQSLGTVTPATQVTDVFEVSGGITVDSALALTVNRGSLLVSGVITGTAGVTAGTTGAAGAKPLTISGSNSFSGGFTMNGANLQVSLEHAFASSTGTFTIGGVSAVTGLTLDNTSGAAMTLNNSGYSFNSFTFVGTNALSTGTGNVALLGTTVTIGVEKSTLTVGGVVSGSNTRGITVTGTGTLALTGANTYTGATKVSQGSTLLIGGAGSINSSTVTVDAGGRFIYDSSVARTGAIALNGSGASRAILGGNGAINTAIVLDNIGDTLAPGNSPGTQEFGVNQTWNSFTYLWEVNDFTGLAAGTDFDQVSIIGGLSLTGGADSYVLDIQSLTLANLLGDVGNFTDSDRSWTILTTTGGITGFDAANWSLLTSGFTSNTAWMGEWSLTQSVNGNDLVLNYAVPEPSTAAIVLMGVGVAYILRRRNSRSA